MDAVGRRGARAATRGRLTLAVAVAVGLVVGAVSAATPAVAAKGPEASRLQRDADAIRAAGATGVLAEVHTAYGRTVARSGVADVRTGRPVPSDAYYRIGSDTKTFTATVVLQLAGEGKIGLTDTVEKWLPGLLEKDHGARITVKNLLQHTSGLPDYDQSLPITRNPTPATFLEERFKVRSPRELVRLAMRNRPRWVPDAEDPAGETRWSYSNTNYLLAAMIVERATGNSWEQEIHERIIEPLGLRHTFTPGTSAYVPEPSARAYVKFPGQAKPTDASVVTPFWADGAIISTPRDLTAFLRALMDGRLLRPAQLAEMKKTVEAKEWWDLDAGARYGLGIAWRPIKKCGTGVWYHGGTSIGVTSTSGVTADGRRAAAVATSTLIAGEEQLRLDEAANALIDNVFCEGRNR